MAFLCPFLRRCEPDDGECILVFTGASRPPWPPQCPVRANSLPTGRQPPPPPGLEPSPRSRPGLSEAPLNNHNAFLWISGHLILFSYHNTGLLERGITQQGPDRRRHGATCGGRALSSPSLHVLTRRTPLWGFTETSLHRQGLIKSLATGDGFHLQLLLPPLRLGVETLSHLILTKLNHELGRKIIMKGFNLPGKIIWKFSQKNCFCQFIFTQEIPEM